jgi:hypothetical protein
MLAMTAILENYGDAGKLRRCPQITAMLAITAMLMK